MAECGVIYVATGAGYLDLACASAASLRAVAPGLAVDLFTDAAPDDVPDGFPAGLFDAIHPVDDPHPRAKLDCLARTRFARTLFLDADTLVTADPTGMFALLDRFELAAAHDVRRASALIQEGAAPVPYAFPQLNSGVLLYRRSPAMLDFLAEWARRYRASGALRDQPILKDMLWESDLRFYVLPEEFNLRRVTLLDAWEPLDALPTILHSHRFMDHLRAAGPRIGEAAALVAAERLAHAAEWAGHDTADPLARFAAAQEGHPGRGPRR